jgi:hypothetical protein
MAKDGRKINDRSREAREMRDAETILGIIHDLLESRMMRKYHVRFGGGAWEKEPCYLACVLPYRQPRIGSENAAAFCLDPQILPAIRQCCQKTPNLTGRKEVRYA